MAAIINNIDPTTLEIQNYSSQDTNLIPLDILASQFDSSLNYIEYTIASANQLFQITDQNFTDYSIINDTSPQGSQVIYDIDINPEENLRSRGFTNGEYNVIYNFLNNEINSTPDTRPYYIKDISSDRTEIKIVSNVISNPELVILINDFKTKLSSNLLYFQDFYLNFGSNNLIISNNILLDTTQPQYEILINLYEPLPQQYLLKDTLWIVTQVADPLAFNVQFQPEVIIPQIVNPTIKGPNFNLPIKDRVNNSSNYVNYDELLNTGLLSSYQQILSYLNDKSINIGIDYTNFSNFIHFSSAETRLDNFYYKIQQIEQYNGGITTLSSSLSSSISESVAVLQSKVDNIIKNFDGYEYYMYYESSSYTWPKSNSTIPYNLYSSTSSQVLTWFGSGNPQSAYYGGQILSASIYDQDNQDYLINTIPEYLRDDSQNEPYKLFVDMIGQHYDNIWVYYKDVTNRYNGDNRLDYGISKDLVADALKSFGVKIYQNNFSTNDLYNAFTGFNSGSRGRNLTPPVGSELITNYITASYDASVIPLDDINKEVYKRLYHNLPYLLKTKGTIPGLRALINCFGVPDTILRISEFGGRDKDTSTYDYFDQQFNYAAEASSSSTIGTSWFLASAWSSSINNFKASSVQFRFKTSDFDTGSNYQLWGLSTAGIGTYPSSSLTLRYSGSGLATGSYSGSTVNPYYQHAYLTFYPKTNDIINTASVYLPFFDHGWWNIMVNKFEDTYTLYAGNKLYYDGYDGNQIGYLSSSSITLANTLWTASQTSTFLSSSVNIGGTTYNRFTGSLQEIRYWIKTGSVNSFKDYVMNPQSIDYSGEILYDDYLAFRLPLGGDLYTNSGSVHPRVTGSWASTSSFIASNNATLTNVSFTPNIETRFLNSPIIGLRGRVTDKIQIVSSSLPTGSVISQYTSIEQSYPSLGSESPDVNLLEIAFSPQNEINDDIIDSLGYFNIGEYIGDPRQVTSSATSYPDLNALSNNFFQKYFDTYDLTDYVRLIKYFDNSLFKMIKDFVPARTSLTSGVVIKQHILERNKYPQPQVYDTQYQNLNVYSSSLGLSSSFNYGEDLTYTGSIDTAFFSGSTGGTFNQYNTLILGVGPYPGTSDAPLVYSGSFIINSTSPINYFIISSSGLYYDNRNTPNQIEFVNGEMITYFTGKTIIGTTGTVPSSETVTFILSSSLQGQITSSTIIGNPTSFTIFSPYISCSNEERFSLWIQGDAGTIPTTLSPIYFGVYEFLPYSQQTWPQYYTGSTGVSTIIHSTQDEFYNGELPGTEYVVTDGELNDANDFKYPTTFEVYYDPTLYLSNITPLGDFLDINTSPNQGEVYLWFDTGSILQPSGVPIQR
jgi:hypothetical protein